MNYQEEWFETAANAVSEARPAILAGLNGTGKTSFVRRYFYSFVHINNMKHETIVFNKDNTHKGHEPFVDRYSGQDVGKTNAEEYIKRRNFAIGYIKIRLSMMFPHIGITNNDMEYNHTISKHGEGVSMAASYIAAFLLATENTNITVFINKPERELHPKAQTELAKIVCGASKSGAKIAVETQSDHFIYGLRIYSKENKLDGINPVILWFDKDAHGIETTEIGIRKDGTLTEYPDGLLDQFEINASALL